MGVAFFEGGDAPAGNALPTASIKQEPLGPLDWSL